MNHGWHKEGDRYRSLYEDGYVWSHEKARTELPTINHICLLDISCKSVYNISSERIWKTKQPKIQINFLVVS